MQIPARTPRARQSGLRLACVLLAVIVLLASLTFSPLTGASNAAYMGLLPAITALILSPTRAIQAALITPVIVFSALTLSGHIVLSVIFMGAVAAATAAVAVIGWNAIACVIATEAALALINPPHITVEGHTLGQSTVTAAIAVSAFVLLGGLWVAVAGHIFLTGQTPAEPHKSTPTEARWYASVIVPLTMTGTWVCVNFFPHTSSWWLLLTFFVVLMPTATETRIRIRERLGGTLLGGIIAALLTVLFPSAGVLHVLAILGAALTIATFASGKRWLFAAYLTGTVILSSYTETHDTLLLDLQRISLTIVGGALALIALTLTDRLSALRNRAKRDPPETASPVESGT
jgi:hypothetical protein